MPMQVFEMTDKSACKYWDCGWCYAPNYLKTNAINSTCVNPYECPISPLSEPVQYETLMTEIEELKAQIKVLEAKLSFLEEMEKHKSPCEEAYKRVYGFYPETYEDSWSSFQDGYIASQKDYKVGEFQPTPQEPEQVADGLKEAFREAVKQGVVSSSNKPQNPSLMKTKAKEVLYAYMDVERDLSQPKILIHTLKELINQLQVSPGIIKCPDIIELCEELKNL